MKANPQKYTKLTKEDIKKYLGELDEVIKCSNYQISKREKSENFIEMYHFNRKRIENTLRSLQVTDFCYAEDNDKMNGEILYIFCKEYEVDSWGNIENKKIYIKINKIKYNNNKEYAFIVSFHEAERNIKYLFK